MDSALPLPGEVHFLREDDVVVKSFLFLVRSSIFEVVYVCLYRRGLDLIPILFWGVSRGYCMRQISADLSNQNDLTSFFLPDEEGFKKVQQYS